MPDAMPTFSITGDVDPFVHVALRQGEKIYCESDAMVMMEAPLELRGKMTGGVVGSLMRRMATGESFFQQHIEAVRGDGDCLLSPLLPGAVEVIDVGGRRYTLNDGAFVAATAGVELKTRTQNVGNALFAQSGGFLVMEASGSGKLAVSGFGSLFRLEVTPGKDVIIDNAHVVCWDSGLHYEVSVTTGGSGGIGGMLGSMINSQTSGEGIILRFRGSGTVLICSRNRESFLAWMKKQH